MVVRKFQASGMWVCPDGYWALYDDIEYNGKGDTEAVVLISDQNVSDLSRHGFDNRASSSCNRSGRPVRYYLRPGFLGQDADGSCGEGKVEEGWALHVASGTGTPNLGKVQNKALHLTSSGATFEAAGSWDKAIASVKFASPRKGPLGSGVYVMINAGSGEALEAAGAGGRNGVTVRQRKPDSGDMQKWRVTALGNREFRLISVGTGKSLDVPELGGVDGVSARQWDWIDADRQKWCLTALGGPEFLVANLASGKLLDVSNAAKRGGSPVQLLEYDGTEAQRWRLRRLG